MTTDTDAGHPQNNSHSIDRPTDQPTAFRPGVSTLRCPACGGTVAIRAPGQTLTVICQNCNASLDLNNGLVDKIVRYERGRIRSALSIGARATLRAQQFEVIGLLIKTDDGYSWEEYLLFNPRIGFRWLVHDHGHWSFGTPVAVAPVSVALTFTLESFESDTYRYRRFHFGKTVVTYVTGEFYWRVHQGDTARTADFVAPPMMLSAEKIENEINWTRLEYLDPTEIESAFKIISQNRETVGPNQPDPQCQTRRSATNIGIGAFLLALIIHIGPGLGVSDHKIFSESIAADRPEPNQPLSLGPIDFSGRKAAVEIATSTSVNNSWVDLDMSLVNDRDNVSYDFTQSISYYSGYDSDGGWSEGSPSASSTISSVPPGTYHLVVETSTASDWQTQPYKGNIHIEISRGGLSWSAFWLVILAIGAYPITLQVLRYLFEVKRWSNSEFNPYSSEDD